VGESGREEREGRGEGGGEVVDWGFGEEWSGSHWWTERDWIVCVKGKEMKTK